MYITTVSALMTKDHLVVVVYGHGFGEEEAEGHLLKEQTNTGDFVQVY